MTKIGQSIKSLYSGYSEQDTKPKRAAKVAAYVLPLLAIAGGLGFLTFHLSAPHIDNVFLDCATGGNSMVIIPPLLSAAGTLGFAGAAAGVGVLGYKRLTNQ